MPARVRAAQTPAHALAPKAGRWIWTCRVGFEPHLFEELAWSGASPRMLGAGLVESDKPKTAPWFGRAGFEVTRVLTGDAAEDVAAIRRELRHACTPKVHVQVWAPDTDAGHARAEVVKALRDQLGPLPATAPARSATASGKEAPPPAISARSNLGGPSRAAAPAQSQRERTEWLPTAEAAYLENGWLGQVCLVDAGLTVLGRVRARDAVSSAPGGQARMWREQGPSRAAMKLDEALSTLSVEPSRGEVCVDLGAAPGGWTARLVARGAKVIAVDPANLTPELQRDRRVVHVKDSAFTFEPDEPADWLFCDMAWRPLEVAQLLAKWGRRGWALHLVANIKLPMQDKNPILYRVRHVLTEHGGWRDLKIRQLYHDRDEVTVTARRML